MRFCLSVVVLQTDAGVIIATSQGCAHSPDEHKGAAVSHALEANRGSRVVWTQSYDITDAARDFVRIYG